MLYAIDMARSTDDIPNGTPNDISRLTVPEAAEALGISPEAVRNRLSRGTLKSEKEHGKVYVLLHKTDRPRPTADIPKDTSRHAGDESTDISGGPAPLISAKDETIRVLSEQLEAERAASAELRRIVAGLVQRVPELEPAQEQQKSPVSRSDGTDMGSSTTEDQQEPSQRRSWWRAFFGLE
jgi:hypothetical protein